MDNFELSAAIGKLLPSQKTFIFAPEMYSALDGGWGSGKTRALCLKALVISAAIPGNVGLIGRFNATDLEDSTMKEFWEVCPTSWIKSYNKTRKVLTFTNNSQIMFRHLSDPNPKRSHLTSINLGWFAIDQAEEIDLSHWNVITGRLRLPRATKRFGFVSANPNGKDWIYQMFFKDVAKVPIGEFSHAYRKGDRLGITVISDENKKSNGGFVDDDYYERLRADMSPEWVARFLDCSFEDFSGKIYKEFSLDSMHIIEPFKIPTHWSYLVPIDVGGDVPWGVPIIRVDPYGNLISTGEFYRPSVTTTEIAQFIKNNTEWQGQNFDALIDPENKVAAIELQQDHGITCQSAYKAVKPGIIQMAGYLHINPTLPMPNWYHESQAAELVEKFKGKGAPRFYIFRSCKESINELDNYAWDPRRPGHPIKKNDHLCDAYRYACMHRPSPSDLKQASVESYEKYAITDPLAYKEWQDFDKRMEKRKQKMLGAGIWTEMGVEDIGPSEEEAKMVSDFSGNDWGE